MPPIPTWTYNISLRKSAGSSNRATAPLPPATPAGSDPQPRRGGGDGPGGVHPLIVGLMRELGEKGPTWDAQEQQQFLELFAGLVKFTYPAKGEADGA